MGRSLLIVGLVAMLLATGVAGASTAANVRLPVAPVRDSADESASPSEVVVVPGDHLWKISARHLSSHYPGRQVAPYWLEVISENEPRLRSGDPDLIYPGEVIELPAVSGRP